MAGAWPVSETLMGWLIVLLLAGAGFAALWRFASLPKSALEVTGAAFLLGVAGYAWQGSPTDAGSPVAAPDANPLPPELAEKSIRKAMSSKFGAEGQWLDLADSLIKSGHTQSAVSILSGGVARSPNNPDLWVGLGNALVVHGSGQMNPASQFAFERAAKLSPNHPGPPFFLGLALVQSGKVDEAGDVWRGLLSRAPDDAPWKADLISRLTEIGQMPTKVTPPKP
jgi:cytochrome c-type biogenesis protein CcmH